MKGRLKNPRDPISDRGGVRMYRVDQLMVAPATPSLRHPSNW